LNSYPFPLILALAILGLSGLVTLVTPARISANALPRGNLDGGTCDAMNGWAIEDDTPNQSVDVQFYIDGPYGSGGVYAGQLLANESSPDLCPSTGTCTYRFSYSIPTQYRDGAPHTLYAYAIDNLTGGVIPDLLPGSPQTFECSTSSPIPPNPTISVTTAAGTQPVPIGSDLSVSWQSTNAPAGATVDLSLASASGAVNTSLGSNVASTGSFSWDVNSVYCQAGLCGLSLPAGQYTIQATLYASGSAGQPIAKADSAAFSIQSPQLPVQSNDGTIEISAVGAVQTVFDYGTDACNADDIPDTPARAFRDANGNVNLISGETTSYRNLGPTLGTVTHSCTPIFTSADNPDYNAFTYHEWIHSPYTIDGQTVYALVHNEWYPSLLNEGCTPGVAVSTTLAVSTDGGATFSHPGDYLVRTAVPWQSSFCSAPTVNYGSWDPSNIVKKDGYYYVLFNLAADPAGISNSAICLGRTQNLASASSWQIWTGTSWGSALTTAQCPRLIDGPTVMYVSYNTYLGEYIALLNDNGGHVYYTLSSNLINWSTPVEFLSSPTLSYGAILDPTDTSRNFEDSGQEPYLYFTLQHSDTTLDKDLVRQQIEITKLGTTPTVCTPDWSCTAWNQCSASGSQVRTCTDLNACNVSTGEPTLSQSCASAPPAAPSTTPNPPTPLTGGGAAAGGAGEGTFVLNIPTTSAPTAPSIPGTAAALETEIASLSAELSSLKQKASPTIVPTTLHVIMPAVPTSASSSPSSPCPVLFYNLVPGSTGSEVKSLQTFFTWAYSNFPQTDVTGYFGSITESAVEEWQSQHGVVSSGAPAATTGWGSVGPKTRAAIAASCTP
jgi:Putative peptidoglycan binding domain